MDNVTNLEADGAWNFTGCISAHPSPQKARRRRAFCGLGWAVGRGAGGARDKRSRRIYPPAPLVPCPARPAEPQAGRRSLYKLSPSKNVLSSSLGEAPVEGSLVLLYAVFLFTVKSSALSIFESLEFLFNVNTCMP